MVLQQKGVWASRNSTFADQSNWAKKGGYMDIWTDLIETWTNKKGSWDDYRVLQLSDPHKGSLANQIGT